MTVTLLFKKKEEVNVKIKGPGAVKVETPTRKRI